MTAIDDKWNLLRLAHSEDNSRVNLGDPISDERNTPDGRGRFRDYQNGSIYWTDITGAHEIHGAIRDKWNAIRTSLNLGYPTSDELGSTDNSGRYNHFENGSIYWRESVGVHEIHGAIRDKWAQLGWERSFLGYPTTDETTTSDGSGRYNHFQNGSIYWTDITGAHEIHGAIRDKWNEAGGLDRSFLGYPTTDETTTSDGSGRYNHFQNGAIYFDLRRVAYVVGRGPYADIVDVNSEILAVHAALLQTGDVLYFSGSQHDQDNNIVRRLDATRVFRINYCYVKGDIVEEYVIKKVASPNHDLFCSGHAFLADGRLLVAGGTQIYSQAEPGAEHGHGLMGHWRGLREAVIYDPMVLDLSTNWHLVNPMNPEPGRTAGGGRWYPTLLTLGDGRVLAASGHPLDSDRRHNNITLEVFDPLPGPNGRWTDIGQMQGDSDAGAGYPRMHLLPNGEIFFPTPMGDYTKKWNPITNTWTRVAGRPDSVTNRLGYVDGYHWTSVLLPLEPPNYNTKILIVGSEKARIIDLGRRGEESNASWIDTERRRLQEVPGRHGNNPIRLDSTAVLMSDGKVLIIGGASEESKSDRNSVLACEVYDPFNDRWSVRGSLTTPRVYHSVALLLPDGRVWVGGSNLDSKMNSAFRELRIELYSYFPQTSVKPVIKSLPASVGYNQDFTIEKLDALSISHVAVLRCSSVTHGFSSDQRYVRLTFNTNSDGTLTARSPPDGNVAPPGVYMLFLISNNTVSVGRFIRIY